MFELTSDELRTLLEAAYKAGYSNGNKLKTNYEHKAKLVPEENSSYRDEMLEIINKLMPY